MRRREFVALLGGAAVAGPLAAHAQQSGTPVIGLLDSGSAGRNWVAAFREGLAESGYVEGRNLAIEYRWAEGRYDQLPALAADLVHRNVAVIVATSTPPALAAKAATTAIPIVFTTGADPVEFGLVTSLSRPGGNLTGVTRLNVQLGPKRLQLLHELVPKAIRIALLVNPTNPNAEIFSREGRAEGSNLGLQIQVLQASTEPDLGGCPGLC
jgi:putative ABC transport system substrate-binding protein